jgi:glycosyltransferase involved in cell wall biosynthesis
MHFLGEVGYDRLAELIAGHRYGLHGRPYEHFGIVVAEYVAGGAIPFVPDSGGQREIVGGAPELCFADPDEAVEKIDRVLSDAALQRRLRGDLENGCEAFAADRFRDRIRDLVGEALR